MKRKDADYWSAVFYVCALTIMQYDTIMAFSENLQASLSSTKEANEKGRDVEKNLQQLQRERFTLILDTIRKYTRLITLPFSSSASAMP